MSLGRLKVRVMPPIFNTVNPPNFGQKKAVPAQRDRPSVNRFCGLVSHTSGRAKVWSTTDGMDIARSVLGERYEYSIHSAYGVYGIVK